ncbi:MAG: helix-turn-helix domain-containing protein [Pseudomonadota bacterium]
MTPFALVQHAPICVITDGIPSLTNTRNETFSTAVLFGAICRLLDLDPVEVVAEAGVAPRIATGHGVLVTEDEFYAIWSTILRLGKRPDFARFVGRGLANGATSPVFFALSCAPDLQTGFERFGRFKHVFGPLGLSVKTDAQSMTVKLVPLRPDKILPASVAGPILTFLHEKALSCTASRLVPQAVYMPMQDTDAAEMTDIFGVTPLDGEPVIIYGADDAKRRLVSENAQLWDAFEPDLRTLADRSAKSTPISDRVRACLIEAIGDGDPSIAYVCERLSKSRSGLLRELQMAGVSFHDILTETRRTLALRYLRNSDLPIKQIANLLAYQDVNAFHRAFKSWTGNTPNEVRGSQGL